MLRQMLPRRWKLTLSLLAAAPAIWGLLSIAGLIVAPPTPAPAMAFGPGLLPGFVIGASSALLLFALFGNLLLAASTRQVSFIWYAAWAALVTGWAFFEVQLSALIFPGMSSMRSSAIASLLAVLAVVTAGIGLTEAIRADLPRRLATALRLAAALLLIVGVAHAAAGEALAARLELPREFAILLAAALAAIACRTAWHHNEAARDFALSFSIPTLAMIGTFDAPFLPKLPAASGDFVVLLACSMQTFCLMLIGARRLLLAYRERDAALSQHHALTELAEQDALTGLYNRRGFVRRADALLLRPQGASLVLIDLDRFKAVNDTHGHDIGDRLLRAIGDALRAAGDGALIGRLGGEEFAAVLPAEGDTDAAADRLRRAIAGARIGDGAPAIEITASAGVSVADRPRAFLSAYRAADRALFAAKRAGRDRTSSDAEPAFAVDAAE